MLCFGIAAMAFSEPACLNRTPLPVLFMRFVLQTLAAAPRLRPFVLDVLSTLVTRAVWADSANQWKGWVMCVQQLVPDSLPVLLQVCGRFATCFSFF